MSGTTRSATSRIGMRSSRAASAGPLASARSPREERSLAVITAAPNIPIPPLCLPPLIHHAAGAFNRPHRARTAQRRDAPRAVFFPLPRSRSWQPSQGSPPATCSGFGGPN